MSSQQQHRGPGGARMQEGGEDWGDLSAQQPPNRHEPEPAPRGEQRDAGLKGRKPLRHAEKARTRIATEDEVAEASDESFPASDPPAFDPSKA